MDDLNEKDWVRILSRALTELVREIETEAGEDGFGGVRPSVMAAAKKGRIALKGLERANMESGS